MSIIVVITFLVISFLITKYRPGLGKFANKFKPEITSMLTTAHRYASDFNADSIGVDMLLYAIIKNETAMPAQIINSCGFRASDFIKDMESDWQQQYSNQKSPENINLTKEAEKCLVEALKIAGNKKKELADSTDVLIALTLSKSVVAVKNKYQIPDVSAINSAQQNFNLAHLQG